MLVAVWLGVAGVLSVSLRKVGPWWRVGLGSLAWPALPVLAVASKLLHMRRRRVLEAR